MVSSFQSLRVRLMRAFLPQEELQEKASAAEVKEAEVATAEEETVEKVETAEKVASAEEATDQDQDMKVMVRQEEEEEASEAVSDAAEVEILLQQLRAELMLELHLRANSEADSEVASVVVAEAASEEEKIEKVDMIDLPGHQDNMIATLPTEEEAVMPQEVTEAATEVLPVEVPENQPEGSEINMQYSVEN